VEDDEDMPNKAMMSPAAKQYLDANQIDPSSPLPTLETIEQDRNETTAGFAVRAERKLRRFSLESKSVTVGGIPCLEVIPDHARTDHTILYFYGGGYIMGSAFEDQIISAELAHLTGLRVVSPEYRLAPEHPWPAAINDGFAVFEALADEVRASRVAIVGESAGGNLALTVLHRARLANMAMPRSAALMSPWCDLENRGDSHSANDGRDPSLPQSWLAAASDMYAGKKEHADPLVSPLNGDFDTTYPPAIITTGTRDILMSQSLRLARIMREAGIATDLRVWDGLWHVFEFYDELPEAEQSIRDVADFIARHFTDLA